ncbi:MAG: HypC/HybG/HupF family hydrogenase formation chaperone [gamma proteobacterium symbiont of Bathyaustriella thionipta]|nr:HypC/HybG/HupF family hydrogenase formation chaperone [gamma proteobacterium symbiont of Bathyaustriella thionipta]MCU7951431.1 HypC/HybG/HupF family hydrogenase formation chaperone [gamma proteobacterium symbiont of Bathyaustriella thionipta]MCU7952260.1 HypC/HybG/HupF family hydrogenase formation chaperone [gamma proteobacterium symbiont of Bathyaustriella thionipta]MCU7957984.1 HypC/HybG/HupF family hydrogenase formation chaperone [gamma proteobacterium symbiont of Bathyaustriella thionipt
MCLALPAKIVSINKIDDTAIAAIGEVKKEISLALLEEVAIGDYVLLHVGYALNTISPEEAERTLKIMAEAGLVEG